MLELDLTTIIFEIINFLVLTVLLYRFLFQPVMRNVKARAVEKERLLTELTREREKLAEDQRILDNRLTVIDDEIKKNLADAIWELAALASERATLIEQTHQEADRILADQNVTLNQQTDPALALGLKARLGDILIDNTLAGQLMETA